MRPSQACEVLLGKGFAHPSGGDHAWHSKWNRPVAQPLDFTHNLSSRPWRRPLVVGTIGSRDRPGGLFRLPVGRRGSLDRQDAPASPIGASLLSPRVR